MQPLTPTQLAAQHPKFLGIAQDYFRPLIDSSVLDDFCLAVAAFVSYVHEDCLLWNPLHELAAKGGLKHPLNHLQTLQKSEAFLGLLTPDLSHLTSQLKPAMDATDNALANLKDFTNSLHSTTCQVDTHRVTLDSQATGATQMTATATIATVSPEVLAANDVRVLDIIENLLLNQSYNATLTDDIVLTIQEYMKAPNSTTQAALALLADSGKLRGVFKLVKQIQNSPEFQILVAENTPDEIPQPTPKQSVVAVATTAEAIVSKPAKATKAPKTPKPAKEAKATKAKPVLAMPSIASIEALESMSRKELTSAIQALNSNVVTGTRGNSSNDMMKETLASHVLKVNGYKAPEKQKPAKPPKTPKAKKAVEVIDLPEGFSWEECKGMKYRQLQQVCKALRSQGLFSGNIGGKGATTENLLKGCADYFRSQGVDIQEVSYKAQSTKELHLPNFAKIVEDKRLEREVTAALKLSDADAKVALEMAVAA